MSTAHILHLAEDVPASVMDRTWQPLQGTSDGVIVVRGMLIAGLLSSGCQGVRFVAYDPWIVGEGAVEVQS